MLSAMSSTVHVVRHGEVENPEKILYGRQPGWRLYEEQINRMLAAIFAAKEAANGKDAIVVSHQLPIWITRSAIEGRSMLHDPRKRECTLASVTSVHFDDDGVISGLTYSEPAAHLLPPKK